MVSQNLERVRERLSATCIRCGRNPKDVQLVAVSKTFGTSSIESAILSGQFDFGENYVQEFDRKRKSISDNRVRWHFVGHLQSKKAKYIVDDVYLIHSLDNLRVAEQIDRHASRVQKIVNVLVEVHTTDEATKFGVPPMQALEFVKNVSRFQHLKILGLMTMGPFSEDPNDSRPSFRQLAELKMRIAQEGITDVSMEHCSMGMSHDFEIAIEEGATIVRLGTAIFGQRNNALNRQEEGAL